MIGFMIVILIFTFRETLINLTVFLYNAPILEITEYIKTWGVWAPLLSIIIMVFQTVALPFPSIIITAANGMIFGLFWGTVISWIGAMIGGWLCFLIAKWMSVSLVRRFLRNESIWEKVDEINGNYAFKVVLIGRLLPFVSFDFLSYAAGLSKMKTLPFLVATGVGMIPGTIAYVLVGMGIGQAELYLRFFTLFVLIVCVLVIVIFSLKRLRKKKKLILSTIEQTGDPAKIIVLVGGGHAHVYFIKKFAKVRNQGVRVKLISPSKKQYYSGMASAFIEDIYNEDEISFDLPKLCEKSGIDFIEGCVGKIDKSGQKVFLENGDSISFDILSLNIGSQVAGQSLDGIQEYGLTVKPLTNLLKIKSTLQNMATKSLDVVIIGAGAAGVEMGLAIRSYSDKMGGNINIRIVNSGQYILKDYKDSVSKKVLDRLSKSKIELCLNERIISASENVVVTQNHNKFSFDLLILASGTAASSSIKKSGFRVDEKGYMLINPYLQSVDHPYIFGVGDCVAFEDYSYVKKVGVYAIKEAPILWDNVLGYIGNRELKKYIPQKKYLSIISLGKKQGILYYKGLIIKGNLAWKIKDFVDRSFMERFKN